MHAKDYLDLAYNSLTGTIPNEITSLTNMGKFWPLCTTTCTSIRL